MTSRLLMLRPLLAAAALAGVLLPAAAAQAGTYTVVGCKAEKGTPRYPTDGWRPIGAAPSANTGNRCATGGSMWARLPGGASYKVGAFSGWSFAAPAGTEIVGYRLSRSANVAKLSGKAVPLYYFSWPTLPFSSHARERCSQPACSSLGNRGKAVPENIITPHAAMSGVRNLYFVAQCGGTAGQTCLDADSPPGTDTVRLDVHATQITLRDDAAPTVGPPSGVLAQRGIVMDVQTLTFPYADAGGGVASVTTYVDGRRLSRDAVSGCTTPYTRIVPCSPRGTATVRVDTRALANAAHALRVEIRDAAGNTTVPPWELAFTSDNVPDSAHDATIRHSVQRTRRGTRFTKLSASGLPDRSTVQVHCLGSRRRCDGSRQTLTFRDRAKSTKRSVSRAVRGRWLRAGARLRVRVVGPDSSIKQVTYRIRASKEPRTSARCRLGGAPRFTACP